MYKRERESGSTSSVNEQFHPSLLKIFWVGNGVVTDQGKIRHGQGWKIKTKKDKSRTMTHKRTPDIQKIKQEKRRKR